MSVIQVKLRHNTTRLTRDLPFSSVNNSTYVTSPTVLRKIQGQTK